jgi:hypothetical protein
MRMRIDPRLSDLAGSGLVLLSFLLVAMAVSVAPIVFRSLTAPPAAHHSSADPTSAHGTALT